VTADLRVRVLEVYAAVVAAVAAAAPRCDASGRCCRFTEYGHTHFRSQFEAEILLETAPSYDRPVSRDGCPFQADNLCTARDERPLGCRIYFCDPAYQDTGRRITEEAVARLKGIADEFDTGWRYAPLHVFLNEADRSNTTDPVPSTPGRRRSLPLV
jgi:hypothetical protein